MIASHWDEKVIKIESKINRSRGTVAICRLLQSFAVKLNFSSFFWTEFYFTLRRMQHLAATEMSVFPFEIECWSKYDNKNRTKTTKKLIKTAINLIEASNDQWFDKVTIKLNPAPLFLFFFSSCLSRILHQVNWMHRRKKYFQICFIRRNSKTHSKYNQLNWWDERSLLHIIFRSFVSKKNFKWKERVYRPVRCARKLCKKVGFLKMNGAKLFPVKLWAFLIITNNLYEKDLT